MITGREAGRTWERSLQATGSIDGRIDHDRSSFHAPEPVAHDQLGSVGTGGENGADDGVQAHTSSDTPLASTSG